MISCFGRSQANRRRQPQDGRIEAQTTQLVASCVFVGTFHLNMNIWSGIFFSLIYPFTTHLPPKTPKQAKLFRIFQQVFSVERDTHQEELRRLGIYVLRKFVEVAPTNPKIYAELLFYKGIREANELETGYCDEYET